ncbi:MAG TPA: hypothetical protein VFH17_05080 [Coriobacteriia bacterium]|nr:hypothetical protein [Coriobacteriia bacterium]
MTVILATIKWIAVVLGAMIALFILGLVLVPPLTRSFTDSWGATEQETATTFPGDDIIPAPRENSTKAITIDAPPQIVYALIQQMGQHRAGWYGWDWFYNATGSSDFVDGHYSTRIVPELQAVKVGDRININDAVAYTVIEANTDQALVMLAGSLTAQQIGEPSQPETWSANTMAWILRPTSAGGTRLILRMRADGTETGFARWMWNGPFNFGGALFSRKTMDGIKRTAEALAQ